jgi:hypothetical protein
MFRILTCVGSSVWWYPAWPFIKRLDWEARCIIVVGWLLVAWSYYLLMRAIWQAYALFTENYSLVKRLQQPQNFQNLQSIQCWWSVREYTLNYKLALNYRLNEYAVGVLLFMMFGSTGGILLHRPTLTSTTSSHLCVSTS